tara:strand:+ start:218 stop:628 length:411 start_codon:yes stop_codon:yes gene_type:complete
MKRLIAVFALAVAFLAGPAFAEDQTEQNNIVPKQEQQQPSVPTTWFKVPIMVDCAPLPMIVEMVAKQYSEKPFVTGSQMIQWPNGRVIPAGMTFTANAESGTWTLTGNFSDGIACVIANGANMAPFIDAEKTKIKY